MAIRNAVGMAVDNAAMVALFGGEPPSDESDPVGREALEVDSSGLVVVTNEVKTTPA